MANGLIDLTGETFGDGLQVLRRAESRNGALWLVRCSHGTEFVLKGVTLRNGHTTSCRNQCPFCPRGHDTREVGKVKSNCAECNRERARKARAKGGAWVQQPENYARVYASNRKSQLRRQRQGIIEQLEGLNVQTA